MRDTVVKMNMNRLALEGPAGTPGLSDLDEQFDPEAINARIESAGVLRRYGEMLVAFSVGTQEADIQFAADQGSQKGFGSSRSRNSEKCHSC